MSKQDPRLVFQALLEEQRRLLMHAKSLLIENKHLKEEHNDIILFDIPWAKEYQPIARRTKLSLGFLFALAGCSLAVEGGGIEEKHKRMYAYGIEECMIETMLVL